MIRNAVDHGIENPEVRVARGKPAEGRLLLRAYHEGGQVHMAIEDDGAGIDPERVKNRAVERGLVTAARARSMTDAEAFALIFAPGFSTAEKVSNVSGRGVGMDVVRTNIEQIGGAVEVASHLGEGTTMRIRIPLTLAIIPALTVICGGVRYAIPQVSLAELVLIDRSHPNAPIGTVHDAPVLRLRDRLLPLLHLDEQLGVDGTDTGADTGAAAADDDTDVVSVVVLKLDGQQFGLVVDAIRDTQEIVVKPLGEPLNSLGLYAGATIMGDGGVALIIDVPGLAASSGVMRSVVAATGGATAVQGPGAGQEALLLLGVGPGHPAAVPLVQVARLEEFAVGELETAGDRTVVQYRGSILPLVFVAEAIGGARRELDPEGSVHVVVHRSGGRRVGLVVEEILDVVTEPVTLDRAGLRPGTRGCAVLQGRVTELLDLEWLLGPEDPAPAGPATAVVPRPRTPHEDLAGARA